MAAGQSSSRAVLAALFGNLAIVAFKYFAAYVSGSSSMLAEGHHSLADTTNQILLLFGVSRSRRRATAKHPFGYGKAQFFWAFVVALVLFGLAGGLSITAGIHKIRHPEPIANLLWSYLAIAVGLFFDGLAFSLAYNALREEMANEGQTNVVQAFRECTDATVITLLMEDGLALVGLVVAGVAIGLAKTTGWYALDGYASVLIGLLLMTFAFLLATELKSMLIGEGLPPRTVERIRSAVQADRAVKQVIDIRTLVLGTDEALVAIDVLFEPTITVAELEAVIDRIEARIREIVPGARCYIEAESLKSSLHAPVLPSA
jgi:cation diffusion facilitator family transporter